MRFEASLFVFVCCGWLMLRYIKKIRKNPYPIFLSDLEDGQSVALVAWFV